MGHQPLLWTMQQPLAGFVRHGSPVIRRQSIGWRPMRPVESARERRVAGWATVCMPLPVMHSPVVDDSDDPSLLVVY